MGKTGLRKSLCENLWGMEAAHCPDAARSFHQHCVDSVQNLEKSDDVCGRIETVLMPGVEMLASYVKQPALSVEFSQNWPAWCKDMQTMLSQNAGDGEKACSQIENGIVKLVSRKI